LHFTQTNHYDRLDPALVRPGRVDLKLEYKKAGKLQALALFHRFFSPARFGESLNIDSELPSSSASAEPSALEQSHSDTSGLRHRRRTSGASGAFADPPKPKHPLSAPLSELAAQFVAAIPEAEFSAAELQGFLLGCKWDPDAAAKSAEAWVAKERQERAAQVTREEERKRVAAAKAREGQELGMGSGLGPGMGMGIGMGMGSMLPGGSSWAQALPSTMAKATSPPLPMPPSLPPFAMGGSSLMGGPGFPHPHPLDVNAEVPLISPPPGAPSAGSASASGDTVSPASLSASGEDSHYHGLPRSLPRPPRGARDFPAPDPYAEPPVHGQGHGLPNSNGAPSTTNMNSHHVHGPFSGAGTGGASDPSSVESDDSAHTVSTDGFLDVGRSSSPHSFGR
jgi:hypothetical protein